MRKLLLPLLERLLLFACQEEVTNSEAQDEIAGASANKKATIASAITAKQLILSNALNAHLAHGDLLGDCSIELLCNCSLYNRGDFPNIC